MGKYKTLQDMSGKVAVVTGGAGILGTECGIALAEAGAAVAIVDLDESKAIQTARRLSGSSETQVIGVGCDITNIDSVSDMVATVEKTLGPIDVLHNNAASKGSDWDRFFDPLETYTIKTWREVMAVNLEGMFLVAQVIGPRMAARQTGSIIQTASIYGATLGPDIRIYEGSEYNGTPINTPAVYSASKAGVHGLTLYFATYWGKRGVRVNTLTPGGIASGQNETFQKRYGERVPLGRMAGVHEIASGLLFLASDASSYITGQNLHIDGGLSAW